MVRSTPPDFKLQSPANPLRVLMTTDTLGGVWTFSLELIASLAHRNVSFTLATMGHLLSQRQRYDLAKLPNVDLRESEYRLEWMNQPWCDVDAAGQWLLEIQDEVAADLVHINGYSHAGLGWNVPVVCAGHSCVLSWWAAVHNSEPPGSWDNYRKRASAGLRNADAIIAPSHAMAESLKQIYGPLAQDVHVIANGRSAASFSRGPKHPFIFGAGRLWDQAKNLAALDAAAIGLPWPVYIAGQHEHPEIGSQFSANNVRMLGELGAQEMRCWLAEADIYALPAKYEPFGLSVLEAALSGCALLLGDIPSLRENWEGAAIFVDPDDIGAIHASLLRLIKHPVERRRAATAAHDRALQLSETQMASRYLALYERVLANRHPSARHVPAETLHT
jgi:glycogen(starch) synthase